MRPDDKQQVTKIPQAHDGVVKSSMKDLDIARDVLIHHLPSDIKQRIKLETLDLEDGTFVDEELEAFHTDILYSVELADSFTREKAYIYLHIEHQSDSDPLISFRVINYCVKIIDRYLKNNGGKTLPVIIPVVIFNGKKLFSDSISVFDLFGDNKALAQQYMFNAFHLVDMGTIPDEEIRERKFSGLLEMILKHIHEKKMMDFLENPEVIRLFKRFIDENPNKNHVISVVKYVNEKANIDDRPRFLTWVSTNLPPKLEKEIMTLAEQWRHEGKLEGEARGEARGKLEGKIEGERTILKRILEKRFGSVPSLYLEKIENADAETLLKIGDKIIEAKTLNEVFETRH